MIADNKLVIDGFTWISKPCTISANILYMKCSCLKCGYEWEAKVEKPKRCPACASPYWFQPRKEKMRKVVVSLDPGQYLSLQMRAEKKGLPLGEYVLAELFRER